MDRESTRLRRRPGRPRKGESGPTSTRDLILESAGRLFATKGYASTSVSDIAAQAGIQQSSVYYYFDNKEAILRASGGINRASLAYALGLLERGDHVHFRLFDLLYYDTLQLCDSPLDFNEVERLAEEDPGSFADFWDDYRQLHAVVLAFVREGIETDVFHSDSPDLTAAAMLALNEGLQKRFRSQRGHTEGSGNPFVIASSPSADYAYTSAMTSLQAVMVSAAGTTELKGRRPGA